jgi:hypothetical protein
LLTVEERRARGRIAIKTRWGHATAEDRLELAGLRASRQLLEAALRLAEVRAAQAAAS